MPGVMEGKRVLVSGVRNKWSISWHIAQSLAREGASLVFSVFGEREETSVQKLLNEFGLEVPIFHCNAADDEQVVKLMEQAAEVFDGKIDGLVHAIAFADKNELRGEYVATSKSGFALAHENSVYSLISMSRAARPYLQAAGGGSIVTLTYLGAERVVPNYNVMGVAKASLEASVRYLASDLGRELIRVNAVSAGPIKTLAASGIADFDSVIKQVTDRSPLRRMVEADEVADAAVFLLSSWARGITGETLYVDCGYHIMGM